MNRVGFDSVSEHRGALPFFQSKASGDRQRRTVPRRSLSRKGGLLTRYGPGGGVGRGWRGSLQPGPVHGVEMEWVPFALGGVFLVEFGGWIMLLNSMEQSHLHLTFGFSSFGALAVLAPKCYLVLPGPVGTLFLGPIQSKTRS